MEGQTMANDVVIVSGCRTPIGSFMGSIASVPAQRLGALVIEESKPNIGCRCVLDKLAAERV